MPIQCRTGCQEQVNYEHFPFPDGFVYFLPKNLDDSSHDCKNLRTPTRTHRVIAKEEGKIVREFDLPIRTWSPEEAYFQDIQDNHGIPGPNGIQELTKEEWEDLFHASPNQYYQEYSDVAWKNKDGVKLNIDLSKNFRDIIDTYAKEKHHDIKLIKKSLSNIQMRCILFPTPFIIKDTISDIIDLSNHYLMLNDFESAIRARLIQEKITHDQTEKILELVKKQNDFKKTDEELIIEFNLTAKELRDKYYRKVENIVKSFIRKKYSNVQNFKNDFPKSYEIANNLRKKSTSNIKRINDDVIEYLNFGSCAKILKIKKNQQENSWDEIENDIIYSVYSVVERRNEIEHDSDDDLEKRISKEAKILGYIYSKKVIDFFEKLNYV
jgi:hypothetical protein